MQNDDPQSPGEAPTQGQAAESTTTELASLQARVAELEASNAELRIVEGEADLTLYQFGTKTAKHYFCRHCGVQPFAHPRIDPSLWVVNLRCVDELDLGALEVGMFDGIHWEESARALVEAMRKQAAA